MQKKYCLVLVIFFALASFILFSCHMPKRLSAGRMYQNVTAYYNTYFNAREIYNLALKKIDLANPDHYDRLLAFYKLGDEVSAAGLTTEMDQVVKKCSALILRHEQSDWLPASYLLMGKAYYIKGDYYQALENFQYIYNTFPSDTMKVAALVWTARTYMQQNKPLEAQQTFELAFASSTRAIKKNSDELYTTAARYYLNSKDTVHCASMIDSAYRDTHINKLKARYCFILAQLNAYEGHTETSDSWLKKVLTYSPGFALEFGARLGLAQSASNGDVAITRSLQKLLGDEKSLDFHDQIFYALGRVSQNGHHYPEALKYYQKSITANTTNINQRALDYLRMGEIYFIGTKEYSRASLYQDSAMALLDRDFPGYDLQKTRQQKLSSLIAGYKLIAQQDTLLMLGSLDSNIMKHKVRSMVEAEFAKRRAVEKAAVEAYKRQLAAASSQFSSQSSAGNQIGSALNRPQVASNSLLSTTGSYSSSSMSSYQPSVSNQMQIYAQGAGPGSGGNSASFGGGGVAGGPGISSNASGGGFGGSGGSYSGSSGTFNTGGGAAFGGTSAAGTVGGSAAVPVYTNSAPVYNQQQTSPVATQPSSGAALYGGQSYNTVGQTAGVPNPASQTSMSAPVQNGNMPAPGQNPLTQTQSGQQTTPFVANTTAVNNQGAYPTGQQVQGPYSGSIGSAQGASGFYFANPQAMSQGFGSFRQRWGNRPLRDNWRRSSRGADIAEIEAGADAGAGSTSLKGAQALALETLADDPAPTIKILISLVPRTPAARDSLKTSIMLAYGANAAIYNADLHDPSMAIATYTEAITRFKNDPRMASFAYELYTIYTRCGNAAKAAEEAAYITSTFPQTLYAKAFTSPSEVEPKPTQDSVLENYYRDSYDAYARHDYARVIERSKHIPDVTMGNYLAAKFDLIKVLSVGNTSTLATFEPQLVSLSVCYPGSPVGAMATTLLRQIDSSRAVYAARKPVLETPLGEDGFVLAMRANDARERLAAMLAAKLRDERKHYFSDEVKGPYYFLILYSATRVNLRPIRLNLSQMALSEFPRLHLQNAVLPSAGGKPAMEIGSFADLRSGLAYYRKFDEDRAELLPLAPASYEYYLISEANLKKLTGPEQLQIYREFFQDELLPYLLGQREFEKPALIVKPAGPDLAARLVAARTLFEPEGESGAMGTGTTGSGWLVAVVVSDMHTSLNSTRLQISLFNEANYKAMALHHESRLLGKEAQVVSINTFKTLTSAQNYRLRFLSSPAAAVAVAKAKLDIIVVSTANYNKLQTLDQVKEYKLFYTARFENNTKP